MVEEERATGEEEKREKLKFNGVTDDVADVILKAISVNPDDRYSSAQRMLNALTELPLKNRESDRAAHRIRLRLITDVLCAIAGILMILVGVYQLGMEHAATDNNPGTEITSQGGIPGYTMPSLPSA